MSKLIADITMSLDGYVAGPNDRPGQGLGEGGEVLHYWVFGRPWTYEDDAKGDLGGGDSPIDQQILDELFAASGASIVGRGMFEAAGGWGYTNPFPHPMFVLTHRADDELLAKAPTFTFVTDGIHSALEQARAVAGEKTVGIGGGADVIRQYLAAGLVDELGIHLAPVLLGGGKRLFHDGDPGRLGLERTSVIESPYATHLRFKVIK